VQQLFGSELRETFLTETQRRILELRSRGLSQAEIARMLKTTRANISILERRARENIEKARRTLELAERLIAPVRIEANPGDDLLELPKRLLKAADSAGIKVLMSYPELIAEIRRQAKERIRGRSIRRNLEIALTPKGEILIS
jgi:hypothetical protein